MSKVAEIAMATMVMFLMMVKKLHYTRAKKRGDISQEKGITSIPKKGNIQS